MIATYPRVLGYSIEVAKMIATFPAVLGCSIEANLKPTVEWIKGLGLSRSQVAKIMQRYPQMLSLSIEANLKPTVEWIKGLGLSRSQVAKVIQTFPQVLGYSIEANLKPTVKWIKGLGLSQSQVARVVTTFPPVLGYSIEANLKLKHCLLQKYFAGGKAEALLAQAPRLWSYRFTRLQHRLGVLKSQGQLSKLAGAMTMPLDAFNRRFPNPGCRPWNHVGQCGWRRSALVCFSCSRRERWHTRRASLPCRTLRVSPSGSSALSSLPTLCASC
ncbi:MTERF4 [Symbiodinium sp. CCMP2456]|nr:MTERF4 [Symbiodinium sp. CCMP2456]